MSAAGTGKAACKNGVLPCQQHWITIRLRYKDDNTGVVSAACTLYQGGNPLPDETLSSGLLEVKQLAAGSYEVSFPDIDASEWKLG